MICNIIFHSKQSLERNKFLDKFNEFLLTKNGVNYQRYVDDLVIIETKSNKTCI